MDSKSSNPPFWLGSLISYFDAHMLSESLMAARREIIMENEMGK